MVDDFGVFLFAGQKQFCWSQNGQEMEASAPQVGKGEFPDLAEVRCGSAGVWEETDIGVGLGCGQWYQGGDPYPALSWHGLQKQGLWQGGVHHFFVWEKAGHRLGGRAV